jgi:hypothetical protein
VYAKYGRPFFIWLGSLFIWRKDQTERLQLIEDLKVENANLSQAQRDFIAACERLRRAKANKATGQILGPLYIQAIEADRRFIAIDKKLTTIHNKLKSMTS